MYFVVLPRLATHSMMGAIEVRATAYYSDSPVIPSGDTGCIMDPTSGYGDINTGTSVVVRDADSGAVIADGIILFGRLVSSDVCSFSFFLTVPDRDYYSIEVSHRGEVVFSKRTIEATNWQPKLTIGP
jgi:hypothetical protein